MKQKDGWLRWVGRMKWMILLVLIIGCSTIDEENDPSGQNSSPNNVEETDPGHENKEENNDPRGDDTDPDEQNEDPAHTNGEEGQTEDPDPDSDSNSESDADLDFAIPVFFPENPMYEAMVFVGSTLNVREQPNSDAKRLNQLRNGAHVFVLQEDNGWAYIQTEELEGWVAASYLKEIPYDSTQKYELQNPADLLVVVNKQYRLPKDYVPENLVIPDVPHVHGGTPDRNHLRADAAQALEEMFGALQEEGLELFATSGYRSYASQQQIFPNNVLKHDFTTANQFSAFPGESEHQTGLTMDVTTRELGFRLTAQFGETDVGKWIAEHAHKYGFIIRYPKGKEHLTGYTYEPWHLRYVGTEVATEIFEQDVTLEQYLGLD